MLQNLPAYIFASTNSMTHPTLKTYIKIKMNINFNTGTLRMVPNLLSEKDTKAE